MKTLTAKRLLLLDGIGALVSFFFLGIVLVALQAHIGLPTEVLYSLATLALLYALFSLSSCALLKDGWTRNLKIIAVANFLHCALTLGLLLWYYQEIGILGWIYFIGEMIVVLSLVRLEWGCE